MSDIIYEKLKEIYHPRFVDENRVFREGVNKCPSWHIRKAMENYSEPEKEAFVDSCYFDAWEDCISDKFPATVITYNPKLKSAFIATFFDRSLEDKVCEFFEEKGIKYGIKKIFIENDLFFYSSEVDTIAFGAIKNFK